MGKIVIVGTAYSGKSSYFYGMMKKMMVGTSGFSIGVDKEDFHEIRQGIKRLVDTSLPFDQRFPAPGDQMPNSPLKLMYQFSVIEEFEWVDYPSEFVANDDEEFIYLMGDTNCLLICVDGGEIQGDPNDLDDVAENLNACCGCADLDNALARVVFQNENLPPVCLMITKYDKLNAGFRNQELLVELMKKVFPTLFFDGQKSGVNRMVTIVPVTLGKDLDKGAKLAPKNVEIPICFAIYLIVHAELLAFQEMTARIIEYDKIIEEWNEKFSRIFPRFMPLITGEQQTMLQMLLSKLTEAVDALRQVLEAGPLVHAELFAFQEMTERIIEYDKEIKELNEKFPRIFPRLKPLITEEQQTMLQKLLNNKAGDVDAFRQVLEAIPLYLNGESVKWK